MWDDFTCHRTRLLLALALFLILGTLFRGCMVAYGATLKWDAPLQASGAPYTQAVGYRIYHRLSPSQAWARLAQVSAKTRTFTLVQPQGEYLVKTVGPKDEESLGSNIFRINPPCGE